MKLKLHINQLWSRPWQADAHLRTYFVFVLLRVVLVFLPQRGYVHPDEFFQSMEVMTGEHFQLEHTRTWEFNNTLPLRSITLPFILLRVPWSFLEFFAIYLREFAHIELLGSYTYLVFPRLVMCWISFINDWSLWRVCRLYSLRPEIRLLALGSSYVMLVFGTRTFSNTIEMSLCSFLLYMVAECMIQTNTIVYKQEFLAERYDKAESIGERVKLWKLRMALPTHNYNRLLLMSTLCVVGVFNRPTFLLFGAPMVFYWLLRGMGTKSVTFTHFNLRIFSFCLAALPALGFFIFCDSLYYKHLTSGELMTLQLGIENFIVTPWNFIKYNLDPEKTAQHGLHPRYIHLLVNIPLLWNILGIIALVSFAQLMLRFFRAEYQGLPRAQSIIGLMSAAIFTPLFFLSLINHQEARFLIPFTFPIVLLHAPKLITGFCAAYPFKEEHILLRRLYNSVLSTSASSKYLLKTWYLLNIVLTLFFGCIHQAGVFPLAQHLERELQIKPAGQQLHLVTSHIYSLPLSFLNMPNSQQLHYNRQTRQRYRHQKQFYLYEYGSLALPQLLKKLHLIISNCENKRTTRQQKYRIMLAIPTSLSDELSTALAKTSTASYLRYDLQQIIYPHLSTEAFPSLLGRHPCDLHPPDWKKDDFRGTCSVEQAPQLSFGYFSRQFSSFVHQFGLALYEFEVRHRSKPNIEDEMKPPKNLKNADMVKKLVKPEQLMNIEQVAVPKKLAKDSEKLKIADLTNELNNHKPLRKVPQLDEASESSLELS